MDNLEQYLCQKIKLNEEQYGKSISFSSSEEIVCVLSDTNYICIYEHANLDKPTIKKIDHTHLKGIQYLSTHDIIFLATDYKFILCDRYTFKCEVCYESEKKIVVFAWNPAETVVVVIDEEDTIQLCHFSMGRFECNFRNSVNADVPSSVYVGWGSENTQFQGLKSCQKKEKLALVDVKYSPPAISWRGNGEQFAVNFYKGGQRFIKVFDGQLRALYVTSEALNLTDAIAFMVAGQCIACTSSSDINTIVIYEKNCKFKSSFKVPENKGTIMRLQYHPQMNILAVYSLDDDYGYLGIYLNANGVWLLKQHLCFPPHRTVKDFKWINLHEPFYTVSRLQVFTSQTIEYYTFRFIINRSPVTSVVSIIDGRKISWYNFRETVIPPPMAKDSLTLSRPVNRILFHPKKHLCVALDSLVYPTVISLENFSVLVVLDNLYFGNIPIFRTFYCNYDNNIKITIDNGADEVLKVFECDDFILEVEPEKEINSKLILPYNDTNSLVPHVILDIDKTTFIYLTQKIIKVNNSCIELDFAFSSNRELSLNSRVICTGVTSFFIFQDYLLFTTATCKLYTIRLSQNYDSLINANLNMTKMYSREIEQGARIVTVADSNPPLIIMVLPRGNLETISCRLLTIDIIEKLLNDNDWKMAIDIMRTERMNWNLLIDLNPDRFLEHIKDFVIAAEFCTNLSMIVNDFSEKNIDYKNSVPRGSEKSCDKISLVKEILHYLTSTNMVANLLSIVSIQHKHFSLKAALKHIKIVYELNPCLNSPDCKKALQLLKNKVCFNNILQATYSLYDVNFLAFVYRNSIEDPRIYEPEITILKTLKPIELRFKMSLKTYNPNEAVKYLVRCDNYEKSFVETFILKHKVEAVAYKSLPPFYKHFSLVSVLYAKHLSLKHKHPEAAFVLKRANLVEQALEEYKEALDWREVLCIMTILNYDKEKRKKELYNVANKLVSANRFEEAAVLLDQYNDDYEKAAEVLVEHKAFKLAVCLARERNAVDILGKFVLPALKSYMQDLKEKICDFEILFNQYFNRLQSLREEKKLKLDNNSPGFYEGDYDLYSESGSAASSYGSSRATSKSRSSQASSKNRKKEARKKLDLREGGFYEDIALIRALHILYSSVFSLGKDVREVCVMLDHEDFQLAQTLHENLSRLQGEMKKCIPLIWPDVFINVPKILDHNTLAIIGNRADLDPKYCVPPSNEVLSQHWQVDFFL